MQTRASNAARNRPRAGALNVVRCLNVVRRLKVVHWLLLLVATTTLVARADAPSLDRIGQGDPRVGYDRTDYTTASRRIEALTGERADLAGAARTPPLGLPALSDPPDAEEIDLGRRLFFDRRLSANDTLSCGMCHVPEQAFTQNELATPVGFEGRFVRRNAPALYNVAYLPALFHDGREDDLLTQIWAPLLADNEMGNPTRAAVLNRVAADPGYLASFNRIYDGLSEQTLGRALAAYQRALLSADSPFDRWFYGGESNAVSPAAKRGFRVFNTSGCQRCHTFSHASARFTDDAYHRTGVEFASRHRETNPPARMQIAPGVTIPISVSIERPARNDEGRFEVTGIEADRWRYRTPTLRNVAVTAPYMHDGSLLDLSDVVAFYDSTGAEVAGGDPERDPALQTLGLSPTQQRDLIAFLESLTSSNLDILAADARSAPVGDRRSKIGDRGQAIGGRPADAEGRSER